MASAMPPRPCKGCHSMIPGFWSEKLGLAGYPKYEELQLYRPMQVGANQGCQLCQFFIASINVDSLDDRRLEKIRVRLYRSTIDSHQGICLVERGGYESYSRFYRVPEPWSESRITHLVQLSRMKLIEPLAFDRQPHPNRNCRSNR